MSDKGYNGWKNRATWNVALWIGNREDIYLTMIDSFKNQDWDQSPQGVKRWADMIFGTETPDGDSLKEVDWDEILNLVKESIA